MRPQGMQRGSHNYDSRSLIHTPAVEEEPIEYKKSKKTDHVSQPMAQRLAPLWEWKTEKVHRIPVEGKPHLTDREFHEQECEGQCGELLPAPSLGELRERLTYSNFIKYRNFVWVDEMDFISLARWFYDVTASADELAKVWLFIQNEGE